MKYAIIENGVVVNVAVADEPLDENWVETVTAGPQWTYSNGVFSAPDTSKYTAAITREERNTLLQATDMWALSDRTMSAEQTAYRQALRDLTAQAGFPTDITWPTKPA